MRRLLSLVTIVGLALLSTEVAAFAAPLRRGPVLASERQPASVLKKPVFSPLINEIMGQLASSGLTKVTLEAPAGPLGSIVWAFPSLRTSPLFPGGTLSSQMGAWLQADASFYQVTFAARACPPGGPPPVRVVVKARVSAGSFCDGAAMGSTLFYNGRGYGSPAAALATAEKLLPTERGPAVRVALGSGMVGDVYSPGTCFPRGSTCGKVVEWASGRWRFVSDFSGCSLTFNRDWALPVARAMAALARAHPLPGAPGVVNFTDHCGDSTSASATASWSIGNDVYSAFAFGSYSVPMLLAAAMRTYQLA